MAKSLTGFHLWTKPLTGAALVLALGFTPALFGQDRDGGRYWDRDRGLYIMLQPGTVVAIRTQDPIDVERTDNRVFSGIVDQDVRGDNGRLAIPRGSRRIDCKSSEGQRPDIGPGIGGRERAALRH
jgi:hypothetical protein